MWHSVTERPSKITDAVFGGPQGEIVIRGTIDAYGYLRFSEGDSTSEVQYWSHAK
jgi:hypothetical protein